MRIYNIIEYVLDEPISFHGGQGVDLNPGSAGQLLQRVILDQKVPTSLLQVEDRDDGGFGIILKAYFKKLDLMGYVIHWDHKGLMVPGLDDYDPHIAFIETIQEDLSTKYYYWLTVPEWLFNHFIEDMTEKDVFSDIQEFTSHVKADDADTQ